MWIADAEGAGAELVFVVTLNQSAPSTFTVAYTTSDGTAPANDDYQQTSGTLTFLEGVTTNEVHVTVYDAHDEGSETMTVTLSSVSLATAVLTDATATGTITTPIRCRRRY